MHNNIDLNSTSNHDNKQVVVIKGSLLLRELSQAKSLHIRAYLGLEEMNDNGERRERWWFFFYGRLLWNESFIFIFIFIFIFLSYFLWSWILTRFWNWFRNLFREKFDYLYYMIYGSKFIFCLNLKIKVTRDVSYNF